MWKSKWIVGVFTNGFVGSICAIKAWFGVATKINFILAGVAGCVMVLFLSWIIHELSNQIDYWRIKYNKTRIELKGRDESILRLDQMLLESLDGQLELIRFLGYFENFMSAKNREVLHDWKIKIQRTKEVYVERWREMDESKVNPQNIDGKLGEESKQ